MKRLLNIATMAVWLSAAAQPKKDFHAWAATPPMGWNSWDCYGPTVVEDEVKRNADYMAAHLKSSGWEYVIVDIRWFVRNDKSHGYNQKDPIYEIDSFGRFQPAINRFPSSAGGKGFKPLADYIHSKGLKFGIHIMRGIPVIAVNQHLKIKGTSATADQIYSKADQCLWLRDMYTIRPDAAAAQAYYKSIISMYAAWGVDFIKVDDLSSPIYFKEEVEMIRKAIDATGRKILLSTSPGETPIEKATHVQQHANMWRTVGDFWDSWPQLKEHFSVFERWNSYRMPGAWPDGDMLPLGHLAIRAERGNDRMTLFTRDEQKTLMSLWAMFRSPLMFGGDLSGTDSFTRALITNTEVIDILKYSKDNKPLLHFQGDRASWIATDSRNDDTYLALFNAEDQQEAVVKRALAVSPLVTRTKPLQSIQVALKNKRKLYLVVMNGDDNIDWDHADWIHPVISNGKDTIALTSMKWKKASSGWNKVQINSSVSGASLQVGGILYADGIGTHANSVIEYDLPEGYNFFSSQIAIDKAGNDQNTGATVKFMVFDEDPRGPMPQDNRTFSVDLQELGLKGNVEVKELWTKQLFQTRERTFNVEVPRHGVRLYRISPLKKSK